MTKKPCIPLVQSAVFQQDANGVRCGSDADVVRDVPHQKAGGVERLVDVRSTPWSRRHPQFGQKNLARSLAEAGIADGSIRACDPKLLAFAAAGALSWIARWHDPAGPLSVEHIARETIGLFVNGIGATDLAAGPSSRP